jgi:hypothetical protein
MHTIYKIDSDNNRYYFRLNSDNTVFDLIKYNDNGSMQWINGYKASKILKGLK